MKPPHASVEPKTSDQGWAGEELGRSEAYARYSNSFCKASHLSLELWHEGLKEPHGVHHANVGFCEMMSRHHATCATCLAVQKRLLERAKDGTVTLKCPAGLHETAVPIHLVDGEVMFLKTGHLLLEPPSDQVFKEMSDKLGCWKTKSELKQAKAEWFKIQVMEPSQYDGFIGMLEVFATQLERTLEKRPADHNSGGHSPIERAMRFIGDHASESLTLAKVASFVGLSRQHFCKSFKESVGLSFIDYLSRLRLEKASVLLRDPGMRISEVAYQSGFQSISQFNRMFHRVNGMTPSSYRLSLSNPPPRSN